MITNIKIFELQCDIDIKLILDNCNVLIFLIFQHLKQRYLFLHSNSHTTVKIKFTELV